MDEHRFRCKGCKEIRLKRTVGQRYCDRVACQRARNSAWRREKYETDADYRANQRASSQAWLETKGGAAAYHRAYRKRRKEQRQQEQRKEQRQREQRKGPVVSEEHGTGRGGTVAGESANRNAESPRSPVKSGRYRLTPCSTANRNAIFVELSVISDS